MATYQESINPLVSAMIKKLLDKEGEKTGWSYCNIAQLLSSLKVEVNELSQAADLCDPSEVMKEAVDVANFAMMLFDNASKIVEEIKKSKP